MNLKFAQAMEHGGQVLQLYPKKALYRSNYALYAMYAGQMDVATKEAQEVLKESPDYVKAYVPLAVAAMVAGDRAKASGTYDTMAKSGGDPGASLAATGRADLALMAGEAAVVADQLAPAVEADRQNGNQAGAVDKLLLIAESQLAQGQKDQALATLKQIEDQFGRETQRVAYARLLLQLGKADEALAIATQLIQTIDQQTRAWGRLIEAEHALMQKKPVDALDILKKSRELADLWLGHMLSGQAYLEASAPTEAVAEFEEAKKRQGEAVAMYLDDVPTLRYLPEVEYWLGRAQQEMKLAEAARASFDRYMVLRPSGTDPMSVDARSRRAAL
jgi:tetratricopeptide (TPR) repeat protein